MSIPLDRMEVTVHVVSEQHSMSTCQNLAMSPSPSQVWPLQKVVLYITDTFLECTLMVEFTDNEGDELL